MNILWIPHGSVLMRVRQRENYFIDDLARRHTIHVLTWSEPAGPSIRSFLDLRIHLEAIRRWSRNQSNVKIHHLPRLCLSRLSVFRSFNERIFRKRVTELVYNESIDVIICGPNHYLIGFPPFDARVPLVFDYVDYIYKESVKSKYMNNSAAVLCASNFLLRDSRKHTSRSYYLPNGVDLRKFLAAQGESVRRKYGLEDNRIVSLIGITCSKKLYFLDTIPLVEKFFPNIKYLIVGDSYLIPKMKRKARRYRDKIVFTGWINYEVIQDYFSASDVGLYPVDKNIYFDAAFPVKVLEYTATKRPVVSTDLTELRMLGFPNVLFAKDNPQDFAVKIILALKSNFKYPDLNRYDWTALSQELEKIISKL